MLYSQLSDLKKKKVLHQILNSDLEMEKVQYQKSVLTPRKIAGKAVTITKGAVNSEIPLLLSKESMKCAGPKIDFLGDKVNISVMILI